MSWAGRQGRDCSDRGWCCSSVWAWRAWRGHLRVRVGLVPGEFSGGDAGRGRRWGCGLRRARAIEQWQQSQSSERLRQKRQLPIVMRCPGIEAGRGLEPDGGAPVAALRRCPAPSPHARAGAVEENLDERDVAAAPVAASSRRAPTWAGHAGDNAIRERSRPQARRQAKARAAASALSWRLRRRQPAAGTKRPAKGDGAPPDAKR